jgi:hypothetical protein
VVAVTAAINDGEEATPPQWVTRDTQVACIILAARLRHRLDLDEASARRLIRHVETALASDPDNTPDSRRPFACRTDDGRLEEIVLFSDYRINWETWDLTRVEQSLWGDPPVWVHAGSLEVSWYKFEEAVTQVLRETGQLPATDAIPPSELEARLIASEQARAKAEAEAETLRQELLIAQIAHAEAEADAAELRRQAEERSAEPPQGPLGPGPKPATKAKPKKKLVGKGGGRYNELFKPAETHAKEVLAAQQFKQFEAFKAHLREWVAMQDGKQPSDKTIGDRWAKIFWAKRDQKKWLSQAGFD